MFLASKAPQLAAAAERGSEHPLGAAVSAEAERRGLSLVEAETFEAVSGRGVRASVAGHELLVGSAAFLDQSGVAAVEGREIYRLFDAKRKKYEAIQADQEDLAELKLLEEKIEKSK